MEPYPFKEIETKWQKRWDESGINHVNLDSTDISKKMYVLVMFSYPSEKKLHIGHWWNYGGTDIFSRFKRMQGYTVLEPMGFDAFGLPAENYAIKHGVHPATTTRNSINHIREQLKQIGAMYDWEKEVDTSLPEYYKWTQWLFLQLYKTGSAYRKKSGVNWCPNCQTVLANEQVESDGTCERCKTVVETRDLEQWFFRITDFAEDLLDGLDRIDWPEATKTRQRNWIGRSEGTEIEFAVDGRSEKIKVFTTRADTLFGVTYVVLAPEHELTKRICSSELKEKVEKYVTDSKNASDIERLSTIREKTGVFTGSYAINPATGEKVPIWTADYVLGNYGTGAVMAVPGHDQRDYQFAQRYALPIKWVISHSVGEEAAVKDHAFEDYGFMYNSGKFSRLSSEDGKQKVTEWLESKGIGKSTVSYRLRDWLISRQRYWGAPIPIVHCPKCGLVPVPESHLPVLLPMGDIDYKPRGTSPLGAIQEFINTECPECGGQAKRDADTMDTFVDSSWYFLRYPNTDIHDKPFDSKRLQNWLPIDVYIGGPEHATGHLIYARYITKYLHKQGFIDFDEFAHKLVHQGIITYNGMRMSKSKGNVVNPDEFVDLYGSDCFRMYLMFMGDWTLGGDWSDEGIKGIWRFQNRLWRLIQDWGKNIYGTEIADKDTENSEITRILNFTVKSVTQDIDGFRFNTAISRLMEFNNALYQYVSDLSKVQIGFLKYALQTMVKLAAPLAPHMSEEMWEILGHKESVFLEEYPSWDEDALVADKVTVVVQVNGKLIDRIEVIRDGSQDDAFKVAMESEKVQKNISGREIKKTIYVSNRILNLVV